MTSNVVHEGARSIHCVPLVTLAVLTVWYLLCTRMSQAATFIPTSTIICDTLSGQEKCEQKILVMGFIDDSADFELEFVLTEDTELTDNDGRQWAPSLPVTVQIKRRNTRYIFDLTPAQSFQNAFQRRTPMPGLLFPPDDSPTVRYCVNQHGVVEKNELDYNSTTFNAYDIHNGRLHFQLDVQAAQGTTVRTIQLTQSKYSDFLPGISARITMDVSAPAVISGQRQVIEQSAEMFVKQGFLVPSTHFSPSKLTNSLGMTRENWASAFLCSHSYGFLVQVNGHIYNQLASFSNNPLEKMLPGCSFDVTQSAYSSTSSYPRLSYECRGIATSMIVLELNAGPSGFKLKKLFGEPMILGGGVLPFTKHDTVAHLYVDIMNKGDSSGAFTLEATGCCVKPNDGQSPYNCDPFPLPHPASLTVESISTMRFNLLLPALPVTNRVGYCDIRVVQHDREELLNRIAFDTTIFYNTREVNNQDDCELPNVAYIHHGKHFCRPPCETTDLVFDPDTVSCVPVDCHIEYGGARDFFNPETNYCETVAVCNPSREVYNEITNTCEQKNVTSVNPIGEIVDPVEYHMVARSNLEKVAEPNCGPHGTLTEDKTSCICDPGWTTNVFRGADGNTFCTMPTYSESGGSGGQNDTDDTSLGNKGEDFLFGLLRMLAELPIEFQVLFVLGGMFVTCLLFGMCGCICFCGCQFTRGANLGKAPIWAIRAAARYHRSSRAKKRHVSSTGKEKVAHVLRKTKDMFLYGAEGLSDDDNVTDFILMQQKFMELMKQHFMEQMKGHSPMEVHSELPQSIDQGATELHDDEEGSLNVTSAELNSQSSDGAQVAIPLQAQRRPFVDRPDIDLSNVF